MHYNNIFTQIYLKYTSKMALVFYSSMAFKGAHNGIYDFFRKLCKEWLYKISNNNNYNKRRKLRTKVKFINTIVLKVHASHCILYITVPLPVQSFSI